VQEVGRGRPTRHERNPTESHEIKEERPARTNFLSEEVCCSNWCKLVTEYVSILERRSV
jgi:hypothetical protein